MPSSTPERDIDRERALAGRPAETAAGGAGTVDHLAAAVTGRAGALQGEEALGVADLALAAAGGAHLRLGAGLGAAAGAGFAGDRGRNPDLGVLAAIGLFEGELHVVAQVGAALAARAAAAAPAAGAAHAEEVVEDIGEGGGEIGAEAVAAAALLEGGVAEAVIGGALVAVLEHLVGLVDFLEAMLAVAVAGILVRMQLHRELAIGALEIGIGRYALDSQHLVVTALGHGRSPQPDEITHSAAWIRGPGERRRNGAGDGSLTASLKRNSLLANLAA